MWGPILFNFVSTIVCLIGFFGIYYERKSHISFYMMWQLLSIVWNAFLVCLYMELGPLSRDHHLDLINLGTGSRSWWEANGPNCEPQFNATQVAGSAYYELKPVSVDNCILPFYAIETGQASVHFLLSVLAFLVSLYLTISLYRKTDSCELIESLKGLFVGHPLHHH